MKKLKLIDKKKIGLVNFKAYIVEDENNLKSFVIYFQNHKTPILVFQQIIPNKKVEIIINKDLAKELLLLKSKNENTRKENIKAFKKFVLEAEQQAKELIFKDKRMQYFTDVSLLKSIEQEYLTQQ